MATMALNVAGLYASAGGLNTAFLIGGASLLLAPKVNGPRLKDRTPPQTQLGQPISKPFGIVPMGPCDVLYSDKKHEKKKKAGKGGGSSIYTYSVSCGWIVCAGPITRIRRIRLNDKVIWDYNGGDEKGAKKYLGNKSGQQNPTSAYRNGFFHQQEKANPSAGSFFTYDSATGTYTSNNGRVRIRIGTETQLPDAKEQAVRGIAITPAYRGSVTIHADNIPLEEFGNQHPILHVLVEEDTDNVGDTADWICAQAKLSPMRDVDMCDLRQSSLPGFSIDERRDAKSWLEELALPFGCDFPEREFSIVARRRGFPTCLSITREMQNAYTNGQSVPQASWIRKQEVDLPREIELAAYDPAREWTVNTGRAWTELDLGSDDRKRVSVSMCLSQSQMRHVAEMILYKSISERQGPNIKLAPELAYICTGDAAVIETPNGPRSVLLKEGIESLFGMVDYQTVIYEPEVYSQIMPLSGETESTQLVSQADGFNYVIIESNAGSDELNDRPYLYIAGTTPSGNEWSSAGFTSTAFVARRNGSVQYKLEDRATMGSISGAPGDYRGSTSNIDETTILTVDLLNGELSSITDDELLNGGNAALLGREGIGFGRAVLVGPIVDLNGYTRQRYTVSRLLRGRRGTEVFVNEHADGEAFVLFDGDVLRVPCNRAAIGTSFDIKVVSPEDIETTANVPLKGRTLMPYSPYAAQATRAVDGSVTATWLRRSRYSSNWWSNGIDPALGETRDLYDVEALNAAGTVVRTWSAMAGVTLGGSATGGTLSYNASEQTADGLTAGNPLRLRIYQMSDIVGRGYVYDVTI